MHVDDTSELGPLLISVARRSSPGRSFLRSRKGNVRVGQIRCDGREDVRVATGRIVESGRVNQGDDAPIEEKRSGRSYFGRAALQATTHRQVGPAGEIDKL